jgi:spore coat protein H
VEEYMKWLSFNYFVRNGDYTDEVWLYLDPEEKKFRIIPWDYDDIFAINPHEGATNRSEIEKRFIFSVEDVLDKKIASDPYLFNVYLTCFRKMLEKLTPEVIKKIFEKTYAELYPYFVNEEIILMSKYDAYEETNLEKMTNQMSFLYSYLIRLRDRYLKSLESRISE